MKAMLVRPTVATNDRYSKPIESLGLAYVTGALRSAGVDAEQLDAMLWHLSTEETIERIAEAGPDLLAFTVVFNYFPEEIGHIAQAVKACRPDTVVIVGGHASSFFPENILTHYADIDAVVIGEGEAAIVSVADAVARKAPLTGLRGVVTRDVDGAPVKQTPERIARLDTLPRPARDLVPHLLERDGLICLSTSRGCYARCTFCSIPRFYGLDTGKRHASGAWLSREVRDSVDEIEDLHERFGLLELLVVDDEFFGGTTFGRERAFAFAETLAARGLPTRLAISCRAENVEPEIMKMLARAGVAHVFVGVEHELKMYGKKHSSDQNTRAAQIIKDSGMSFQAGYMIFNHRSRLADLRVNLDYLKEIGECKPWQIGSAVEPHFGTPLADLMEREGGAQIGQLSMSSSYPDPEVRLARDLISEICAFFVPFQGAIQRMQSAITVEWRRPVRGRSAATKAALADMETKIHTACATLVGEALDLVEAGTAPDCAMREIGARQKAVEPELWQIVGLVAMRLKREEGGVTYHTQLDLIRDHMRLTGTRYPGLGKLVA
ncbi:MAG: B12-binding domain-containing radical SAM protein [Limimaricola sp.]